MTHLLWHRWQIFPESPIILLIVLFIFTHLIYYRYFRHIKPCIASGVIVMATGLFMMECLPKFHVPDFMMLIAALELFVVWAYLGVGLIQAYLQDELFLQKSDYIAIGTWVAGTVAVALLLDQTKSILHGLIAMLGLIAVIIYLAYLVIIVRWFQFCIRRKFHVTANGMILLATVSTQAIVLLLSEFYRDDIPDLFYQTLILLGIAFYFIGLYFIFRYTIYARVQHFIANWPNTNCINHGAMAITGLALLNTQVFPEWLVIAVAWYVLIFFFVIEILELIRLFIRLKIKGIVKGMLTYGTSQWARVFTFGMFYAFMLSYYNHEFPVNIVFSTIAQYGYYVVTALFIIELSITLSFVYRTYLCEESKG